MLSVELTVVRWRRDTGGCRSLGFLPQHARMSCFSHRWIPDKRAFMNYKMKIDNPLSVSSVCAQRNTHSKRKLKSDAKITVICNASCSLVGVFPEMSLKECSSFNKFTLLYSNNNIYSIILIIIVNKLTLTSKKLWLGCR